MTLGGSVLAGAVALAGLCGARDASAEGAFTLSSPDFGDGERLTLKNAGNNKANRNCVGEYVSPALRWSNPPAGEEYVRVGARGTPALDPAPQGGGERRGWWPCRV